MKSDREFLDGIYSKAEKLPSSISSLDHDLLLKKNRYNESVLKKQASYTKYVKYGGMVAAFLLLLSSTLYFNNDREINNQIDNHPVPSKFRMIHYPEQLVEEATDIVELRAKHENDVTTLDFVKSYKDSGNGTRILNLLNNDVIALTADQSAVIFIDVDSKDSPIMDIFIWAPDRNCFINPYGEVITEENLNNLD